MTPTPSTAEATEVHVRFHCQFSGAPPGTVTVAFPANITLGELNLIAKCFEVCRKAHVKTPSPTKVRLFTNNSKIYVDRQLTSEDDNNLEFWIKPGKRRLFTCLL
jgi:hypothetical protein